MYNDFYKALRSDTNTQNEDIQQKNLWELIRKKHRSDIMFKEYDILSILVQLCHYFG